jgi:cobalamin synthase
MPIRIRWTQGKHLGLGLMIIGLCGLFQVIFVAFAQYLFLIGSLYAVLLIPLGAVIGLVLASVMIFESFADVERRQKIKSQFRKKQYKKTTFWSFPIVKPLVICFITFTLVFILAYLLSILTLTPFQSFLIAENIATMASIVFAYYIERYWAKIKR